MTDREPRIERVECGICETTFTQGSIVDIAKRVAAHWNADHPLTSEPYCSIKTIARMPPDLVYREHIAYLGTPGVPKDEYPEICQEALEYREEHRNYIQKAIEWLEIND
jgi:hypothetical protein